MERPASEIRYLIFDVETAVDGELVAKSRYQNDGLSATEAIVRYRDELISTGVSDFMPYTYHVPACMVVAKVRTDLSLDTIVALDRPKFRPEEITRGFWRGWEAYGQPTLVTFNGRSFDLPLLELACFRYGISVPLWFSQRGRAYEQPRNRYNVEVHLDLQELLTNFGATRFAGGLHLAAALLGLPGKMDICGAHVQQLYETQQMDQIADYCTCDVLDTYFLFLRSRVVVGEISTEREAELIIAATERLIELEDCDSGVAKYRQAMCNGAVSVKSARLQPHKSSVSVT